MDLDAARYEVERSGRSYAHPCDAVAFAPSGEFWQATWLFDFEPSLYVDIGLPAEITADRIVSTDLDLDVVRRLDGTVEILDRDEFDEHRVGFGYPADIVDRALATAARIAEALGEHDPPFTRHPGEGRLDGLITERRATTTPPDWVRAPNIAGNPDIYELENEAIARDGRLDAALHDLAPWDGRTLLDIGCGTGFWLPRYAERADRVIGVEPDPQLVGSAQDRVGSHRGRRIEVFPGSAERLPLADGSIDIAHARFAYFFGPGAEAGLAEVARVLRPGGVLLVIDNSWRGGEFADLLRSADTGNAAVDPDDTDRWWAERGATRHELAGGWAATSPDELERILRIEFPAEVVDGFVARRPPSAELDYRFAVFDWRP